MGLHLIILSLEPLLPSETVFGPGWPRFARFSAALGLPRWPWLAKQLFLGLFLKNNGPVWHFQPPVCSFWLAMGHFWHFCRPGLQQPHICNTQTAHPGQRKPPNVQTTNPFGHQCMARHHRAPQRPMQDTWFSPQIWLVGHFAHSTAVSQFMMYKLFLIILQSLTC